MTLAELYACLVKADIPEDRYYLHGLYGSLDDNEKTALIISLSNQGIEYETYFREKGEKHTIRKFTTEAEACEYVYLKLMDEQIFLRIQEIERLSAMTVNERLWVSGLMDAFEQAQHQGDKARVRQILRWLKVDEQSIEQIIDSGDDE